MFENAGKCLPKTAVKQRRRSVRCKTPRAIRIIIANKYFKENRFRFCLGTRNTSQKCRDVWCNTIDVRSKCIHCTDQIALRVKASAHDTDGTWVRYILRDCIGYGGEALVGSLMIYHEILQVQYSHNAKLHNNDACPRKFNCFKIYFLNRNLIRTAILVDFPFRRIRASCSIPMKNSFFYLMKNIFTRFSYFLKFHKNFKENFVIIWLYFTF